jgi:diguanylate cyclase (GGDEF)-like protein/PAS domain S-box-containing protein
MIQFNEPWGLEPVKTDFYQRLIEESPLGFAYHKILLDKEGNPDDYEFIDVNPAFEKITGLKKEDIINKTILTVLPDIQKDFDWIGFYGEVALTGESKSFEQYSPPLKKYFNIKVYSPKEHYFVTFFSDITEKKIKENNQREQEYFQRTILQTTQDGFWVVDEKGQIDNVNDAYCRMIGYSKEELKGMKIRDLEAVESEAETAERIQRILKNGSDIFETQHRKKDGSLLDVEVSVTRMDFPPHFLICFCRDITARKKAEKKSENYREELDEKNKLMESILDNAPMGIWLIEKDSTPVIINKWANENFAMTFDEIAKCHQTDQEALAANHPVFCEEEVTFKDGKKHILQTLKMKIKKDDGQVKGILGIGLDVTRRKLMEISLREGKAFLSNLLESIPVPVFHKDIQGRYLGVNSAFEVFFGKNSEEILGKTVFDINPFELAQVFNEKDLELFRQPDDKQIYETKVKTSFGEIRDMVFHKASLKDSKGQVIGLIGAILDITERKRLEELISIEKEWLRTTLLSIGDGVISIDDSGKVILMNKVAEQLTGWTQQEAEGKPLEEVFQIINELTREKEGDLVNTAFLKGEYVDSPNQIVLISKDGSEWPIEDSVAPIKNLRGNIQGVVLVFRDITEKKKKQAKIEYLSFHDQLTGLYNRRFFEEELKRLDVERNLPLTILMLDVNGLKLTNDAFGHFYGDQVLKKVAGALRRECRSDDIISRIGGDEFVVLLPKTDFEQARIVVDRIHSAIIEEKVESINLSVSYGWETKKELAVEIQKVLSKAEDYMYRNKLSESDSMRHKTIKVVIKTLYEKSKREEKHSKRVSQLCKELGAAFDLGQEDISELQMAGLMHDIGKIIINDDVLNKPADLNESEWSQMKKHSEVGYRILSSVNEYAPLAEYVLAHHERWDGKGYPRGLKGTEIPLQSRIISIIDAYDAMTGYRPYRMPFDKNIAIEEIKKNSGTQFDPAIVKVFVEKIIVKETH